MADGVQNKNAATEDDLGSLHRMVTDTFKLKLGKKLKKAKKSLSQKDIDAIPLNELVAAGGWCRYNEIKGNAKKDAELSGVVDELEAIRRKNRGKNSPTAVGE